MSTMPPLNTIANTQPLDATPVQQNFQSIAAYVDAEAIVKDGTKAMTAPLTLSGPPTAPLHAATKGYVDAGIPTGSIIEFAGAVAPTGWALCQGQEVSSTDPIYVPLFAVIGYAFGTGAGSNFKLPDFRGRMGIGVKAADALFNVLGETGGVADTALPSHTHVVGAHVHTVPDHTHPIPHTHSIAHDHPSVATDPGGAHTHTIAASSLIWALFGAGTLGMDTSGTGHSGTPSNLGGMDGVGDHQHNVDIPNYTGNSGAASSATSGSDGAGNSGSTAPSLTTVGVSATNQNYPPFLAVNKMIKL
jgi:microcystin-dependent protein